jgi:hypothetical protein
MWAWAQLIVQLTEQECTNSSKEVGVLGVICHLQLFLDA